MTEFYFTIPGPPVGKARPRLGRGGHVYTPAKTAAYETKAAYLALKARGRKRPIEGPVAMTLVIWPDHVEVMVEPELDPYAKTGKPDGSNVLKGIEDALNKILYADDAQISTTHIYRRFTP